MHDKPGVVELDVTSATFVADLEQALQDGYTKFSEHATVLVLTRGYGSQGQQ